MNEKATEFLVPNEAEKLGYFWSKIESRFSIALKMFSILIRLSTRRNRWKRETVRNTMTIERLLIERLIKAWLRCGTNNENSEKRSRVRRLEKRSRFTRCLIIQSDQLTTGVPKYLRHEIAGIKSCSGRIDSWQLVLVVINKFQRPFLEQGRGLFLIERRHFIITIFLWKKKTTMIFQLCSSSQSEQKCHRSILTLGTLETVEMNRLDVIN